MSNDLANSPAVFSPLRSNESIERRVGSDRALNAAFVLTLVRLQANKPNV